MLNYNNSSVFYVSYENGNDGYNGFSRTPDGFLNGPFKTLSRALDAVKTYRVVGNTRPMRIELLDDAYLDETVEIGKDTGAVTIASFNGKKRVVGGIKVTDWKEDVFNGKPCLSAQLPPKKDGAEWDFTDFWVNGKRASVTRFPKTGRLRLQDAEQNGGDMDNLRASSKWIQVNTDDLKEVEGIENAYVHYHHFWVSEHSPVETYDKESGKITLKYPSFYTVSTYYEPPKAGATTYYLTGIPSSFQEENEWYLERKTGKVYYIPRAGEKAEDIVGFAPVVETLFRVQADDVRFCDLELTCTRGEFVCYGYFDADINAWVKNEQGFGTSVQSMKDACGAIVFVGVNRGGIDNCYMHGLGLHAVEIDCGCKAVRIERSVIEDIGAGGVKICGGRHGCDEREITSRCTVRGNRISDLGKRYVEGCGVLVCDASEIEISENEICDLDYSGVSLGWVWGYEPSNTYGNIVRGNHIHHIRGGLSDLGGIYLLGKQRGTVIAENRIHDIRCGVYGGWGLYLDEGTSEIVVENNVIYRAQTHCLQQHYGANNVVRNNIFAFGGNGCVAYGSLEYHEEFLMENNILLTDGSPVYGAAHNWRGSKNFVWDLHGETPYLDGNKGEKIPFFKWQSDYIQEEESRVINPSFENAESYDFRLKENSPVIELGFKPLTGFLATGKGEK